MKKALKIIGIVLGAIILVALIYVAYVFGSYNRIEDKQPQTVEHKGSVEAGAVTTGETYSIMTYNVGFGAYTQDFSFFMDGGKSSWAKSEPFLRENLEGMGKYIKSLDTDFVILQEVDQDGTRTYHVPEVDILEEHIGDGDFVFALNYHSAFLMWPLTEPHGANKSGLLTYSSYTIDNAIRRSLPIATSVKKIVDLDRCYNISRIPVDNGKFLCIYDVHLSAYGSDASVRAGQLEMLFEDMQADYAAGNYVIVGGDFNHNLRDGAGTDAPGWAQPFPQDQMPAGYAMAYKQCDPSTLNIAKDTCRDSNIPYIENGQVTDILTVMVDGFIISDNIKVVTYENQANEFMYSDHNPVKMEFVLE